MPMCRVRNDKSESAKGSNSDCLTVINRICGDPFVKSFTNWTALISVSCAGISPGMQ